MGVGRGVERGGGGKEKKENVALFFAFTFSNF